jgi:hypothetical protein
MTPNPKTQPKQKPQTEAEWEENILSETLNDVIDDEGNVDFDKLRSTGVTLDLEELYTADDTDES